MDLDSLGKKLAERHEETMTRPLPYMFYLTPVVVNCCQIRVHVASVTSVQVIHIQLSLNVSSNQRALTTPILQSFLKHMG